MENRLYKRHFLKETDFEAEELIYLIELAAASSRPRRPAGSPGSSRDATS